MKDILCLQLSLIICSHVDKLVTLKSGCMERNPRLIREANTMLFLNSKEMDVTLEKLIKPAQILYAIILKLTLLLVFFFFKKKNLNAIII